MSARPLLATVVILALLALTACQGAAGAGGTVRLPPTSGGFDYQLGGAYDPAGSTAVLVRDASAEPHPGCTTSAT
ncbi:hypothetical protein [Microterricola viridarii]|uniref:Uncharacterized protein n=1 Tax=Microterricola viridarii TaxID=412690 RepID=A0A0X8E169_9MICO|nr:hypothetical protein [Microterricola viridarii]AMB58449.1 hypothetical protein AWU67_05810 [Microterricola viridarii]